MKVGLSAQRLSRILTEVGPSLHAEGPESACDDASARSGGRGRAVTLVLLRLRADVLCLDEPGPATKKIERDDHRENHHEHQIKSSQHAHLRSTEEHIRCHGSYLEARRLAGAASMWQVRVARKGVTETYAHDSLRGAERLV